MPPSPTGLFHVGTVRTMLFNWLFARGRGGKVVLRFEDTDVARSTEAAVEHAEAVLRWLGIDWDDGPYRQTQRYGLYQAAAEDLIAQGKAYRCYCTEAELAEERARRQADGRPLVYSGRCRHASAGELEALAAEGRPAVVRLALPESGTTVIEDVVHGTVEWDNALQGDHVILRPDGSPTYQFANPFDDIAMGVTSGEEFRDAGVIADALVNYLALVGWSFDDHTNFMTRPELIERFTLERVTKSPGVFDPEKLEWLNGEHLRALAPGAFVKELQAYLVAAASPLADRPEQVAEAAPLVQEKMRVLGQFPRLAGFLFGPPERDPAAWEKVVKDERAPASLRAAREALAGVDPWAAEAIEAALHAACERQGVKPRVLFMPVRVALTGSTVSPGLYESLELVGRDESLARLDAALTDLAD